MACSNNTIRPAHAFSVLLQIYGLLLHIAGAVVDYAAAAPEMLPHHLCVTVQALCPVHSGPEKQIEHLSFECCLHS